MGTPQDLQDKFQQFLPCLKLSDKDFPKFHAEYLVGEWTSHGAINIVGVNKKDEERQHCLWVFSLANEFKLQSRWKSEQSRKTRLVS